MIVPVPGAGRLLATLAIAHPSNLLSPSEGASGHAGERSQRARSRERAGCRYDGRAITRLLQPERRWSLGTGMEDPKPAPQSRAGSLTRSRVQRALGCDALVSGDETPDLGVNLLLEPRSAEYAVVPHTALQPVSTT